MNTEKFEGYGRRSVSIAKKHSILVVDDEPDIVSSLLDTFVDKYKMYKATNAKEALEIINNNQIDLVICDQRMPGMTGVELFEKMEKDHPLVGRVLLSGYSNIQAVIDAINKGNVDKYISKPWDEDDILHIVLEVINARLKKAINERKRADQELKKSEQELRDTLELSTCVTNIAPSSHIIANSKGTILSVNPASENIFGCKTEELIGKNVSLLAPSTNHDEYKRYIEDYLNYRRSGKPEQRRLIRMPKKCKAIRKNGEEFSALIYVREAKVKGDEVFVGIIEDITERKREEEKLRKARDYIRSLIDCSLDMIVSVDKDRRIVEFNKAAEQTFGYKKEEVVGKRIEMFYASSAEAVAVQVMFEGKDHLAIEIMNKRKNGEIFPTFLSTSLLKDKNNNMIGSMGVSRDITKQKFVEEELRKAKERAETANKAKDEFLSNMSHEIRTPLNGIIGMSELLMDHDFEEEHMNQIRTMNAEANSLLGIINNILDFSKIEAQKLELEEIPFDLRVIFDDVANSFAYKAVQKGLELNCFLSPDIPSRLIGDPTRLRQILTNLADNALKFTHQGEIYIKGEITEDLGEKVKIRFLVIDTGIGVSEDKQAVIFGSFSQADGSTTRKYGGTGLGTAISKQLTELMGGEIGVESTEGEGSTFWFTAVFNKQIELDAIQTKERLDLTDKKVLIVDDHRTSRHILMEYLKSWGCLTVEAPGGKKALDILKDSVSSQEPFDLILTDFQMPEMSGFDLAKEIRKEESLKRVPIILLTSVGGIGDAKSSRDKGIQGYLTKPIRQDYLHKAIESILVCFVMEKDQAASQLVTRHTVAEEDILKDFSILLAEDYKTNQEVAIRHLHSAGYKVDLVENGQQAMEAYKRKHYDIIFMDIQMPVMDGYEATSKIRAYEGELKSSDPHLETKAVIIAMTAHATTKDRKKCLSAGMDDFISKPLKRRDLLALVDKWASKIADSRLSASAEDTDTHIPRAAATENPQSPLVNSQFQKDVPINFEMAVEEFEGDKEYLMEALEGFLKNVRKQIKSIRQAISDGDVEVVRKEAHSIKGGAANLTADNLSRRASELEKIGKSGVLKEGTEAIERLEKEFQCLEDYVEKQDDGGQRPEA